MTLMILAAAMVGFTGSIAVLAILVLREVETERTDLARAAHPCTQTLTRYQG